MCFHSRRQARCGCVRLGSARPPGSGKCIQTVPEGGLCPAPQQGTQAVAAALFRVKVAGLPKPAGNRLV